MSGFEQLYSGTTLEGFEALKDGDVVREVSEGVRSPTGYLWFSPTFADASDYAGKNPSGVSGDTDIVLDIRAPGSEIEPSWAEIQDDQDYILERDTRYSEYFRAKSYPSDWVEGYWQIEELPMGSPQPEEFEYVEI